MAERSPRRTYTADADAVLLDVMLGKLAVYLRVCGFDTVYAGDRGIEADGAVRELAEREDRVLVSRDRLLVDSVDNGVLLTEREVSDQFAELRAQGFELTPTEEPRRCGRCNGPLKALPPDTDRPDYAPSPAEADCWRCRDCGQCFWKGSHWDRMVSLL